MRSIITGFLIISSFADMAYASIPNRAICKISTGVTQQLFYSNEISNWESSNKNVLIDGKVAIPSSIEMDNGKILKGFNPVPVKIDLRLQSGKIESIKLSSIGDEEFSDTETERSSVKGIMTADDESGEFLIECGLILNLEN